MEAYPTSREDVCTCICPGSSSDQVIICIVMLALHAATLTRPGHRATAVPADDTAPQAELCTSTEVQAHLYAVCRSSLMTCASWLCVRLL